MHRATSLSVVIPASDQKPTRRPPISGYFRSPVLGELPVDGAAALLLQQAAGPAERAGAEEAPVSRVRAGVGRLDERDAVQQRGQAARVPPPQDRDQRSAA